MKALWTYIVNIFTFGAGWRKEHAEAQALVDSATELLQKLQARRIYAPIRTYAQDDPAYWDALSDIARSPAMRFLLLDTREAFIRNMLHAPTEKAEIYVGGLRALDTIHEELAKAETTAASLKEAQTEGAAA
jgi:hypothetical protein